MRRGVRILLGRGFAGGEEALAGFVRADIFVRSGFVAALLTRGFEDNLILEDDLGFEEIFFGFAAAFLFWLCAFVLAGLGFRLVAVRLPDTFFVFLGLFARAGLFVVFFLVANLKCLPCRQA